MCEFASDCLTCTNPGPDDCPQADTLRQQEENQPAKIYDPEIVAVLSTTVLPLDGIYSVETVDPNSVDIDCAPHYIGHPGTKVIVEKLGAYPATEKLFVGLQPGETAVCFSIAQGKSTRAIDGFTSPHQDVTLEDLTCRLIRRLPDDTADKADLARKDFL